MRRPELGFQDDGALLTAGPARNALLDAMKKAGATRLRANAIWGQVARNGGYDWSALDSLVNEAGARGIRTQLTLMGTPRYMAQSRPGIDTRLSWRHADPAAAGKFAEAAAQHFKGRVDRYSAWNEPNLETFLADRSPKRYRALYQAMRRGIKGVDAHAQVMLGELMPGASGNPNPHAGAQAANFLQRVLAAGPGTLRSEGLALHPYGWQGERAGAKSGAPGTYLGINQLGAAQHLLAVAQRSGRLQTNRGGRVPLYLTEYGIARSQVRDPKARATMLARAYRAAEGAGARELMLYQMAPSRGSSWDTATDPRHIRAALARVR